MFLRKPICKSTVNCWDNDRCPHNAQSDRNERIQRLKNALGNAEAVIIGAGAGMSASAGFAYGGERFYRYFSDFGKKYGITDMYSGGFYPFDTLEEYWAWWSRQIYVNRYDAEAGKPYTKLLELVGEKDFFVITTNVDHQFQKAGVDKKRLFYTQGDYGLWQCSKPCCDKTWDNESAVRRMVREQKNMRIPSSLIPKCPFCGAPAVMNLRCDDTFVQDEGWYKAAGRYDDFLRQHSGERILFLELGVGMNTPIIIKFPFWKMTAENENAVYACINDGEALAPPAIKGRTICVDGDIGAVLEKI